MPNETRGTWGVGTMHHVAWRVADDAIELRMRERVAAAHRRPTEVIDRFWFKSVYFLEPGGVLFEIATDGPGFTADEPLEHLGEQLVLPPWLEPNRHEIEASLPPLAPTAPV
jgi:glyoxalase family protein